MLRKVVLLAASLVVPSLLAAQDVSKVAAHRATHFRGEVVGLDNRPVTPATPAVAAIRAMPSSLSAVGVASPASPAMPAALTVPASPSKKPANPGQSNSHRP